MTGGNCAAAAFPPLRVAGDASHESVAPVQHVNHSISRKPLQGKSIAMGAKLRWVRAARRVTPRH